jgi:hypothetical protein
MEVKRENKLKFSEREREDKVKFNEEKRLLKEKERSDKRCVPCVVCVFLTLLCKCGFDVLYALIMCVFCV